MLEVKGHANTDKKSCVECHDPHAGADKNLLKAAPNTKPSK